MPHPLAEVFGFPADNLTLKAEQHRIEKLCPFNNKVAGCTKDRLADPLGVCSVIDGNSHAITCPIRFRENWLIASDAAAFFFPPGSIYKTLTEVRLVDATDGAAGNVDAVIVQLNNEGEIIDFGSLEIQAVYISGNIRNPFAWYMDDRQQRFNSNWMGPNYPRPDYLSSSRKRLAPQMLTKGGIFKTWGKKQAIALHKNFYNTLPDLPEVPEAEKGRADIAWFIYDLVKHPNENRLELKLLKTVYTEFSTALAAITVSEAGKIADFESKLTKKLRKG
jgi:hypothetical protein